MGTFVIRATHSSDQWPAAIFKFRELVEKTAAAQALTIPGRLGIKMLAGPFVFGEEHEAVAVVEADRIETVNKFLLRIMRSGLMQCTTVWASAARPQCQALADGDTLQAAL